MEMLQGIQVNTRYMQGLVPAAISSIYWSLRTQYCKPGVVSHACKPTTWEAERERMLQV